MHEGYIHVNSIVFPSLFAISEREQQKGLMDVKWPPPIMSFVYESPRINKFWMSNTPSPLDILFCYNGKVTQICKGEPYSTSVIGKDQFSDLVIEFPEGIVSSLNIKLGHKASIISPNSHDLKKILASARNF